MFRKVAIFSPGNNIYSETFIKDHQRINGEIFIYHSGDVPTYLEGYGKLDFSGIRFWFFATFNFFFLIKKGLFKPKEIALVRSLKKNRIEFVLAEFGPVGAANMKVLQALKIPFVVVFHGYDAYKYKVLEQYKNQYIELFKTAKRVVAVSKHMKTQLISLGCPKEKIVWTPCGPSEDFLHIKPNFSEDSFIAVGRFVNKKSPVSTILAFSLVLKKYPNTRLYFAGEGELLESCKNLVRFFKIEERVIFLGVISREEFVEHLGRVRGFVQHSVTASDGDSEGTPVGIMEASLSGVPVISTKHGGIPEVIINGETGLLSEELDVYSMAENMLKICGDLEFAKKLGRAGKEHINKNFSQTKHRLILEECLFY